MSTPQDAGTPAARPAIPREMVTLLAEAVLALRATSELAVSWDLAREHLREALGALDARLLRVDRRSGALYVVEDSGVETPYLAEHGGPVEWVMRNDRARYDETLAEDLLRETLLWHEPPVALATLPLVAGSTAFGFLLVGFAGPHDFEAPERLLLQTMADALALSLERAHLRRALDDERAQSARLERRLASARESSAGLLNLVVGELRSPLASVLAYCESLERTAPQARAERTRLVAVMREECARMGSLLQDVGDLSRIDGGGCTLRLGTVSLRELGRAVGDRLGDLAREREVTLEIEGDETRVEVDHELLRRAVENLVHNAIEFSPRGGTVAVTLAGGELEWTCTVEDEGPPLPDEHRTDAFAQFHRLRREAPPGSAAAAHGPDASRLGLAITRGIVELHGGRLWVEQPEGVVGLEVPGPRFCFGAPVRQTASPRARRVARQALGRPDLQPLFDAIVEMIAATLESSLVSLVVVDPDRGDLFVAASTGHEGAVRGRRTTLRSGVAGAVAAWGYPLLVDDIETDRRFRRLNHPQYSTKSLLSVPLRVEGEVIGVVNAANKHSGESFDEDDLGLVVMLTERVGSAIERACAYPDSERVVEDALAAVRAMTRLKREFALGGRRAVKRARALARRLGLAPAEVDLIGYVASIHDLGMVRLGPETRHPDQLDDQQRLLVRGHPEASVEILRPLEYLGQVRELVLAHHERWDGSGYPSGLRGDEIPLGARILAVVDAWESLTSARPWRIATPREEAAAELRREAGRQFDPEVVEAWLAMLDEEMETPRAAA
jgi:HD-GYP domain-containing protein (c-di-GMP phosphodiesterase class II)/signal transduction histidine kinase